MNYRILIVDDEPNNRDMLRKIVEKAECTAIEAENGRQALDEIENQLPDLVLLDLMMPEMDGFEFVSELSRRELTDSVPVIVITARELSGDERNELERRRAPGIARGRSHREPTGSPHGTPLHKGRDSRTFHVRVTGEQPGLMHSPADSCGLQLNKSSE